jgi:hypothetical protein
MVILTAGLLVCKEPEQIGQTDPYVMSVQGCFLTCKRSRPFPFPCASPSRCLGPVVQKKSVKMSMPSMASSFADFIKGLGIALVVGDAEN